MIAVGVRAVRPPPIVENRSALVVTGVDARRVERSAQTISGVRAGQRNPEGGSSRVDPLQSEAPRGGPPPPVEENRLHETSKASPVYGQTSLDLHDEGPKRSPAGRARGPRHDAELPGRARRRRVGPPAVAVRGACGGRRTARSESHEGPAGAARRPPLGLLLRACRVSRVGRRALARSSAHEEQGGHEDRRSEACDSQLGWGQGDGPARSGAPCRRRGHGLMLEEEEEGRAANTSRGTRGNRRLLRPASGPCGAGRASGGSLSDDRGPAERAA